MVSIKKKIIENNNYYYLEHSFRKNGEIHKKEKYLGRNIPKDIKKIEEAFLLEFYEEQWFIQFNKIRENFSQEQKNILKSVEEKEMEHFSIKFTYNTNKIEGSTLTLRETANLLEKGITPAHRAISEIKETEAHKEIFYNMLAFEGELSLSTVLEWHTRLFQYTKKDIAGKIRNHQVNISGSKFIPPYPIELDILLKEFFNWYQNNKKKLHSVYLAALAHLKFVTIHPFSDGNGRIARLLMNYVLNKNGFPMLIIPYSQRNSYYTALERSQLKNKEKFFILWFFRRYLKEYKKYLK